MKSYDHYVSGFLIPVCSLLWALITVTIIIFKEMLPLRVVLLRKIDLRFSELFPSILSLYRSYEATERSSFAMQPSTDAKLTHSSFVLSLQRPTDERASTSTWVKINQ